MTLPCELNRTYDFAAVVTCATVIYGFAVRRLEFANSLSSIDLSDAHDIRSLSLSFAAQAIVPALLWVVLRYVNLPLPLIQTIAIYGYSLSIFVPFTVYTTFMHAPLYLIR